MKNKIKWFILPLFAFSLFFFLKREEQEVNQEKVSYQQDHLEKMSIEKKLPPEKAANEKKNKQDKILEITKTVLSHHQLNHRITIKRKNNDNLNDNEKFIIADIIIETDHGMSSYSALISAKNGEILETFNPPRFHEILKQKF